MSRQTFVPRQETDRHSQDGDASLLSTSCFADYRVLLLLWIHLASDGNDERGEERGVHGALVIRIMIEHTWGEGGNI